MDEDKKVSTNGNDLFEEYSDEIAAACQRAVREALLRHKLAGNPIAVSKNGKVVLLQPEEIELNW